jgi:hypothetical protein
MKTSGNAGVISLTNAKVTGNIKYNLGLSFSIGQISITFLLE